MELEKGILRRIKESREQLGLTQADVASKMDISLVSYSKLERGEIKLTINNIEKIASIFNIKPHSLIIGYDSQNSNEDIKLNLQLAKENEELKKDLSRFKHIVDNYQEMLHFIEELKELFALFKKNNPTKPIDPEELEKNKELFKDFKL